MLAEAGAGSSRVVDAEGGAGGGGVSATLRDAEGVSADTRARVGSRSQATAISIPSIASHRGIVSTSVASRIRVRRP